MMRSSLFLPLALLLTPCAAAQTTRYTAYPLDELHGTFGHWAPYGILSTGNADECRVQHLILAPWLPPVGALITGIEASPHVEGNVPYDSLTITLSTTSNTTLSTVFANNLDQPQVVFQRRAFSINWATRTQWYAIDFQTPFVYDGRSNLVIEHQKVIDRAAVPGQITISHQMSNAPMRRDLPQPLFREGPLNSGAATAATGSIYSGPTMLLRLRWRGPDTLTITSTRPGGSGLYFRAGSVLGLHVQAAPGSAFVDFIDGALAATPVPTPPVAGAYWFFPRFLMLGSGAVGPGGTGSFTATIPADPALAGARFYFQAATVAPNLASLSWTNVVDAVLAQ